MNLGESKARVLALVCIGSLGVPWRVLDRPKVFVANIRVFVDMSLVAIGSNKREYPGLVTIGMPLLLGV